VGRARRRRELTTGMSPKIRYSGQHRPTSPFRCTAGLQVNPTFIGEACGRGCPKDSVLLMQRSLLGDSGSSSLECQEEQ